MPTEIRKIIFTKAEIQAAAVDHCHHNRITMPNANIGDVVVHEDDEATVVLTFTTSNPAHPNEVKLDRENAAAALIRFCRDLGIPLPRRGRKILKHEGDSLALMVQVVGGG